MNILSRPSPETSPKIPACRREMKKTQGKGCGHELSGSLPMPFLGLELFTSFSETLRVLRRLTAGGAAGSGSSSPVYPEPVSQGPLFVWLPSELTAAPLWLTSFLSGFWGAKAEHYSLLLLFLPKLFLGCTVPRLINAPSTSPGPMLWKLSCKKSRTTTGQAEAALLLA